WQGPVNPCLVQFLALSRFSRQLNHTCEHGVLLMVYCGRGKQRWCNRAIIILTFHLACQVLTFRVSERRIGMENTNRRLMWHGMFLFLLGLLTGFVETRFANVRM